MDPINQLHTEFYDNHAYAFDEPHTIPSGWDAEALMRPAVTCDGEATRTSSHSESVDDAKNPVS